MTPPPKFEKKNHHYVPRFWLKRFRDANKQLWVRSDAGVRVTSPDKVMLEHWLYTEFDEAWRPGDAVEDWLSEVEGRAAPLFAALDPIGHKPGDQDWASLCTWLALTACRHPDAMKRAIALARQFAFDLTDAHAHTEQGFALRLRDAYGLKGEADDFHQLLTAADEATLLAEAGEIENLSPQDPRLPALMALEGVAPLAREIAKMDLVLIEAPANSDFILGDTPVALANLRQGFATPLSAKLALGAWPPEHEGHVMRGRKQTTPDVVGLINADQFARARNAVVGPTQTLLQSLT